MKPASEKSGTTPQPAGAGWDRDLGHWRAGTRLSMMSAGVATYPTHARSVIELLRAADAALYQAKA